MITNCVVLGNVRVPPRPPQLPLQPSLPVSGGGQPNLQNPQSIGNLPLNSQQNPQNSAGRLPPPRPSGPPPQPQPQQQQPFQQQQFQRPSLISNIFGIFG